MADDITKEKLSEVYDSLCDSDKKSVGLIGISFIRMCGNRLLPILNKRSNIYDTDALLLQRIFNAHE